MKNIALLFSSFQTEHYYISLLSVQAVQCTKMDINMSLRGIFMAINHVI